MAEVMRRLGSLLPRYVGQIDDEAGALGADGCFVRHGPQDDGGPCCCRGGSFHKAAGPPLLNV